MVYRIGKIKNPEKKHNKLSDEDIQKYLKFQNWENLENSVINGWIWIQYLSSHDYKKVYLKDPVNSPKEIIEQIIEQLN